MPGYSRGIRCLWLSALALLLGLAACGGAGSQAPERGGRAPSPATSTVPVVVTRDDGSLKAGCRPREVATLLNEFLDAFNRGDPAAPRMVAPELAPNGGWYSVSDGTSTRNRHFVARDRDDLSAYFAARHRQNERLRLVELRVNSSRGDIEFALERRADDLARLGIRGTEAGGKGAIDCERRKIVVWSMGMPHGGGPLCPAPAGRRAIVACVRRPLH